MTMRALIPVVLVSAMALQGCATNADGSSTNILSDMSLMGGSGSGLTAEQRALRNRDRDYAEARVTGAAIGAVIGGVLCVMADCSPEQTAAAAGLGGAAGYAGAAYLARDNQNFVASQDSLQADIRQARQETSALQQDVRTAQSVLDYQEAETARLNAAYRAGQTDIAALRSRAETMQGDIAATRELRTAAEQRVANLNQTIGTYDRQGYDTAQLRATAAEQQRYVEQLRRIERAMVGTVDDLPPEALS
ncbi:MAG: hypothetical protein ACPGID_13720 [Rubricella sp.]